MKTRLLILFAGVIVLGALGWLVLPKPPLLDGVSFSHIVLDRNGEVLRVALTPDDKYRIWTPLENVPPELVNATLVYEDRFFQKHPGVNPVATLRCAWRWVFGGRAGASTITMQVARLRFGIHSRTLGGKCVQMLRALELERHYTKAQILEAYFNLAPYGRNIEGAGAASRMFFGKNASALSRHECLALSVIPQSPARRALRADRENPALIAARNRLLAELPKTIGEENYAPRADAGAVWIAPHFTTEILREKTARQSNITTTLDAEKQRLVEQRIRSYVETKSNIGIQNAAALLVDFRTMEVLAQAGSADFFDSKILGQNDGTRSPRSPGSTLKPFVYALAMEQGIIHPLSILKDAPHSYAGYNPENFDHEFLGPIQAGDALARSRNLPAVELASRLAHPSLYEFLKAGGVGLPHDEKSYGLALPLGDAAVTMQDLVRLYAVLANGGVLRPLHRVAGEIAAAKPQRVLSAEASFLTLQMLGLAPRPDGAEPTGAESVFWKTGTSHGFHDAWSVAVFDRYVLAVWIGNFDGHANPAFVGRRAAGPLLFSIVDALRMRDHARPVPLAPPPGANLRRVEFCAVSGSLPTAACAHRVQGWFIPGVSPISPCSVHREILVDAKSGLRVSADDGTRAVRHEVFEFWPSDLLALFEKAGLPRRVPPPFAPDSDVDALARCGRAPQITSPKSGVEYSVRPGDGTRLALQAETDSDVRRIFWFADRAFLGASSAREPLTWQPPIGTHHILALDDHGRSSSRAVTCTAAESN